jgi:hypothetical protein
MHREHRTQKKDLGNMDEVKQISMFVNFRICKNLRTYPCDWLKAKETNDSVSNTVMICLKK